MTQTGFIRGGSNNVAEADLIDATTGAAFSGVVTVYVTIDRGTQTLGTENSGLATSKGNGLYQYYPSSAESEGTLCTFTFIGTNAVPRSPQYWPITQAQSTAVVNANTAASVTVNALLTSAIQRLLAGENAPTPDELNTALLRLNDLIDAWKIEGLTVYQISRVLWTITTASSYSVGTTGDVVIDRPSNASGLVFALLDSSGTTPFERPMANYTEAAYQAITLKTLTSPQPLGFYYSPTAPLGTLTPWPIPSGSSLQGVMYAPSPAAEVGLYDTLSLPPGYRRFYRDNLAVELAADFDVSPSAMLMRSADESKAMVKRANVRITEMTSDAFGLTGRQGTVGAFGFLAGLP